LESTQRQITSKALLDIPAARDQETHFGDAGSGLAALTPLHSRRMCMEGAPDWLKETKYPNPASLSGPLKDLHPRSALNKARLVQNMCQRDHVP